MHSNNAMALHISKALLYFLAKVMSIKLLSESAINKIAAGEVVERPLAVVKELVENSIDAGATSININFIRGGRTLISVSDNGAGIKQEELSLAIQRHATSKLNEDALDKIEFLGFRGEALPSIAAVSRMKIASYMQGEASAWEISVSGGEVIAFQPCVRNVGTTVEVRDLFCFTPSRLKFLKSESYENASCIDLITRLALSAQHIEFKLTINDKLALHVMPSDEQRLEVLLGSEFIKNTLPIQYEANSIKIQGFISLPTFHNALSTKQYFYVNNRAVKDKLLIGAMRAAYASLIPSGRYPISILFINVDSDAIDVNVHPTKAEVRFRDEQKIRYAIIDAIRHNLCKVDLRHSTTTVDKALSYMHQAITPQSSILNLKHNATQHWKPDNKFVQSLPPENNKLSDVSLGVGSFEKIANSDVINQKECTIKLHAEHQAPKSSSLLEERGILGIAQGQINKTYIIAEVDDGMIIVDQHAAHERLVFEQLKKEVAKGAVTIQYLIIPEIVELGQEMIMRMLEKIDAFKKFGIIIERNGINQILVSALPALLGQVDINALISDLATHLSACDNIDVFSELIEEIYGNIACKNSIKAGKTMNIDEMNALLRAMESTPFSGQCNHGRPTYIKLTIKDLEKIFERT